MEGFYEGGWACFFACLDPQVHLNGPKNRTRNSLQQLGPCSNAYILLIPKKIIQGEVYFFQIFYLVYVSDFDKKISIFFPFFFFGSFNIFHTSHISIVHILIDLIFIFDFILCLFLVHGLLFLISLFISRFSRLAAYLFAYK
jgi:hypothetical protein